MAQDPNQKNKDDARFKKCLEWIDGMIKEHTKDYQWNYVADSDFHSQLKDGYALCLLILPFCKEGSQIQKNVQKSVKKVSKFAAQHRVNIGNAILGIKAYMEIGNNPNDDENAFETNDLYDASNLIQVAICLEHLSNCMEDNKVKQPFVLGVRILHKQKKKKKK